MIAAWLRFWLLVSVKIASRLLWRFRFEWVGAVPSRPFEDARIVILLNHTSLFEPIFLGLAPLRWLWKLSRRGLLPGANSTLERRLVGRFFRFMVPDAVPITRTLDQTWRDFLSRIGPGRVVLMAPEGRMKRLGGLDKFGKPMTVRGGIADVLERVDRGTMVIFYSGGLHHVQAPGESLPRLFKLVRARIEELPIEPYKKSLGFGTPEFRERVIAELERRRDRHCRWDGVA